MKLVRARAWRLPVVRSRAPPIDRQRHRSIPSTDMTGYLARNRKFESTSLQRGVSCEPEADRKQPGSDGDRHGHRHQPRHHNAPDNAFIRPPPRSPRSPAIVPAVGCVWVTRFARSGRRNVNPLDSSSRRFRPRTAFPPIARSGISASPTRRRPPPTAPRAATRARLDQCRLGRAVLARHPSYGDQPEIGALSEPPIRRVANSPPLVAPPLPPTYIPLCRRNRT
jgi:hypothetical protein